MIKHCLFPAAGYGTRFLPATKSIPKEMLPIVNRPLIHYGVKECYLSGIQNIGIIYSRNKYSISQYFDINYELEHKLQNSPKKNLLTSTNKLINKSIFSFVTQQYMHGLGDAILTGKNLVYDEAFGVILADDLCLNLSGDTVMQQMIEIYNQHKCSIVAIQTVSKDKISNYGIIDGQEIQPGIWQLTKLVEKPSPEKAPSNKAIIGRYILTPDIFPILEELEKNTDFTKQELQITDALNILAQTNKVLAYEFKGKRFDCGNIKGFVEATNFVHYNFQILDKLY